MFWGPEFELKGEKLNLMCFSRLFWNWKLKDTLQLYYHFHSKSAIIYFKFVLLFKLTIFVVVTNNMRVRKFVQVPGTIYLVCFKKDYWRLVLWDLGYFWFYSELYDFGLGKVFLFIKVLRWEKSLLYLNITFSKLHDLFRFV